MPPDPRLRLSLFLRGAACRERLLPLDAPVTIGSAPGCTLRLPLPFRPVWTLFQPLGRGLALRFDGRLQGSVSNSSPPTSLATLRDALTTESERGIFLLPLEENARGRIRISRSATLLFYFVASPFGRTKLRLPESGQRALHRACLRATVRSSAVH